MAHALKLRSCAANPSASVIGVLSINLQRTSPRIRSSDDCRSLKTLQTQRSGSCHAWTASVCHVSNDGVKEAATTTRRETTLQLVGGYWLTVSALLAVSPTRKREKSGSEVGVALVPSLNKALLYPHLPQYWNQSLRTLHPSSHVIQYRYPGMERRGVHM